MDIDIDHAPALSHLLPSTQRSNPMPYNEICQFVIAGTLLNVCDGSRAVDILGIEYIGHGKVFGIGRYGRNRKFDCHWMHMHRR